MKILVVEDDPDIRITLEQNLGDAGYVVVPAATAGEALRLARAAPPDLVLLDLMLPDRPGTEVCRILRGDPRMRTVPIIMLTARIGEDDRIAGFEHGADDYIGKPFSMRELMLRIDAVLKRNRVLPGPANDPLRIDSSWAAAREQIRVWEGFSLNHFERGEWKECQEICRTILRRFADRMSSPELAVLHDRIQRCSEMMPELPSSAAGGAESRNR